MHLCTKNSWLYFLMKSVYLLFLRILSFSRPGGERTFLSLLTCSLSPVAPSSVRTHHPVSSQLIPRPTATSAGGEVQGSSRTKADRADRFASVCLHPQFVLLSRIPAGFWTSDPRMRLGNKRWWGRWGGMVNGTIKYSGLMKWFVKRLDLQGVQDQLCRTINYITLHWRHL